MMILEDGSGVPLANSYATIEAAESYHALRLNADWSAATPAEQGSALVRATDRIEAIYAPLAPPLTLEQGLQWPTQDATALPPAIVAATLMLALYALHGPLMDPPTRGISKATQKLEGVGELMTEYDPVTGGDPYPAITSLLLGVAKLRGATGGPGALTMVQMVR